MSTHTKEVPRFVGISLCHPGPAERRNGEVSYARLSIDRRLKSGMVDDVRLTEDDLVQMIESAAAALRILRGIASR